ncbi:MAG TPA: LuxR C-terminal-related transcriptional regulator [Hanamia sp.]|nr:LuxR C-terminal-related transcriptional regulator [Hanamia sp.]
MKNSGNSFTNQFSKWKKTVEHDNVDWTEQLRILSEISELITPQLSVRDINEAIYENINHLLDASQFAVGLYDEKEAVILYQGIIEDGKDLPDFIVHAIDNHRLASWCIRHEEDIFINDMDRDIKKYLEAIPEPLTGFKPKAAIYTPLKLAQKVVGLLVVRTRRKNVYQPHHLYILKTVGNFIVRALELSRIFSKPFVRPQGSQKEWRWGDLEKLPPKSKNALEKLTEREKEVLMLLVSGLPNKSIAQKLYVSSGTVKTHTLNIYQKLDVSNRTSAILKAISFGWIL